MSATVESVKDKLFIEKDRRNLPNLSLQEFSLPLAANDALNKVGIGGNEVAWGEEVGPGSLWMGDSSSFSERVVKMDYTGSVIQDFSDFATGLEVDTAGSIWAYHDTYGTIIQWDQSGNQISQFGVSGSHPGVGIDSDGCIWSTNESYDRIDKYTRGGADVGGFAARTSINGLGVDSSGCLWFVDAGNDIILQYTQSGSQVSSFPFPTAEQHWGLTVDAAGCLWSVTVSNTMFQMTQSGSVVYSTSVPGDPRGLGMEGPPPA